MNTLKKHIIALMLGVAALPLSAQTLEGAYFMDGAFQRHHLNPALMPSRSYVAIPVLGNINFSASSDLSYSDFIYPSDGDKLHTFLSDKVSAEDFSKRINDRNAVNMNFDLSLVSFGFFKWNGFNTFDVKLHSTTAVALPGDMFRFLKEGSSGETSYYDFHDVEASNNTYVEVALGHSHRIGEKWTVGAKLKGLVGAASASAHFDKLSLTMSEDVWHLQSHGVVDLSCAGVIVKNNEEGEVDGLDFDTDNLGVAGGGAGIDLGVTYTPVKNLVLSLAVTDLGFIQWNKNLRAITPEGEVVYDGFENIGSDDYIDENGEERNPFDDEVDRLGDELEALFTVKESDAPKKRTSWLSPRLSVGAEYQILKNRISFGVLSTTRFYNNNIHTSFMGSVNLKPLTWIQVGLNGAVSNLSNSFGAILVLGPLFVGAEVSAMRVTPEYIPLGNHLTANVNFGLSIPLGKDPKLKKKKEEYTEIPIQ